MPESISKQVFIWEFWTLCYNTQMPKHRIIIVLGILIALMPIMGFPSKWESVFEVIIGLSIVLVSIWSTIDKKITLRAKAQKRRIHKIREAEIETMTQEEPENNPVVTEENS
jgi:hypothetical protein